MPEVHFHGKGSLKRQREGRGGAENGKCNVSVRGVDVIGHGTRTRCNYETELVGI